MKTFTDIDRLILSTFSPGFGGAVVPEWIKPWLENGLGSVTLFASNTPNFETARKVEMSPVYLFARAADIQLPHS